MTKRLALVTGASSGIGEAFARLYAERGFDVALVARRRPQLEKVAAEIKAQHGVDGIIIEADLADPAAPKAIMDSLVAAGRVVDVLVNNAGYNVHAPFQKSIWADHARFMQVTFIAPLELFHAVIPGMTAGGYGRIINVSSLAAVLPALPGDALYCAIKTGLNRISWGANAELRKTGIHVTSLCPGLVDTEIFAKSGSQDTVDKVPKFMLQNPRQVAEIGYRAVEKNQPIKLSGWTTYVASTFFKCAPAFIARPIITSMAKNLNF